MHNDASHDRYDVAMLVSGDSDLARVVQDIAARKQVVVVFPPGRHSVVLAGATRRLIHVGHDAIRRSQLPGVVMTPAGVKLERPAYWR